jgi:biopolymer transport protein ExbB
MLTGFSTNVLANIASNGQVKPAVVAPAKAAPAAKAAAAPAKPAAAPAKS